MLSVALGLLAACSDTEPGGEEKFDQTGKGVFILCEGNHQSGNASLSYYLPESRKVENGVFHRANDRRLGDTGQSLTLTDSTLYIAVESSGIVWGIHPETFRVRGQLTAGDTEHMINPRYVHLVTPTKAYVTDLFAPYITVFNPQTFTYLRSIPTHQPQSNGYSNTEEMVQWGKYVFTNCWSYSRSILVIDTEQDAVVDSIVLSTWQPKRIVLDKRGKLWAVTDGGYSTSSASWGDNVPHLYRIDAATRRIEAEWALDTDEASVDLALAPEGQWLYILNNDIYRMGLEEGRPPVRPFIQAPVDTKGKRHKLYGIACSPRTGELYVADAVDYRQSGVVYRYTPSGTLADQFRTGIIPSQFAFK